MFHFSSTPKREGTLGYRTSYLQNGETLVLQTLIFGRDETESDLAWSCSAPGCIDLPGNAAEGFNVGLAGVYSHRR